MRLFRHVEAPPLEAKVTVHVDRLYKRLKWVTPPPGPSWWDVSVGFGGAVPIGGLRDLLRLKWRVDL